jgi:hypothetical protein
VSKDSGKQNTNGLSSDVFSTPDLSSDAIVNNEQKKMSNTGLAPQLRSELNQLANSVDSVA